MSDNVIITPDSNPSETPENTQHPQEADRLTPEGAQRLAGAVAQLHELRNKAIIAPGDEKIKAGLEQFVQKNFLRYADEFIGCYFTMRSEYEPLVLAIARVLRRTDNIRQGWFAQEQAMQAQLNKEQ